MKLRQATGADCVWYQESIQNEKPRNCCEVVARMYGLELADVMSMPAREMWPMYQPAQDAIMEGFPMGETD